MKGWKTIIFNGVMLIGGIAGAAITPELAEEVAAGVLIIASVVNMILRAVTNSPIFNKG